MKKILFVINTLGRAGAETALFALLNSLDQTQYDVSLYVIMAQGEMIPSLPPYVHLLNPTYNTESVLSKQGRKAMVKTVLGAWFRNGHVIRKTGYLAARLREMKKRKRMQTDKLLWRMMSDGSIRFDQTFDLAVAYLEGASTYYVADYVKAKKKAAFVHIDYESSGYTREMDRDCYERMDRIFTVSAEVKEHFLKVYPQYRDRTMVFHNMIDRKRILRMAEEPGGFTDHWDGTRLLTVGRLTPQKAYDIAVKAMRLIRMRDTGFAGMSLERVASGRSWKKRLKRSACRRSLFYWEQRKIRFHIISRQIFMYMRPDLREKALPFRKHRFWAVR